MSQAISSSLAQRSQAVVPPETLQHFLDTFLYREAAVLVDEILAVDEKTKTIEALVDSTRPLPFAECQRVSPEHPAHVSAAELLMATGSLGCLHAYLFHGCRWDEGWAGFGNRIHRADFKRLATLDEPVRLISRETRARIGPTRCMIRFEFEFDQGGELVYRGDQSAMFVKGKAFD